METKVQIGDVAPDFALPDAYGKKILFSDLRGRAVVLVFMRHVG